MKARLEFLHNLHSRIGDQTEFAKAAKDVEQEIEQQAGEIKAVEKYVDQASDPK